MVTIKNTKAEFKFFRPDASSVSIVGDFNDWDHSSMQMVKTSDGYWTANLFLPAGEFKFRYFADGEWFTDYAAFGVEPGPFGMDSLVRMPAQPVTPLHITTAPAATATQAAVAAA